MAQEPGAIPPFAGRARVFAWDSVAKKWKQRDDDIAVPSKSVIDDHVRALRSGNDTQKARAAAELAFFASRGRNPNNSVLVEAGAVPPLVDVARSGSAYMKERAALALMGLASDSGLQLVRAGYIELLVELMRSGGSDLENAGGALFFLLMSHGRNCTQIQNAIRAAGDIPRLVELAGENTGNTAWDAELPAWESLRFAHPAVKALYDLARDNDENQVAIALAEGGVVALVKLARTGIFWSPGATLHDCWRAGSDSSNRGSKARAIAARMLAERRAAIVHKCVGAVLPPEMASLVAAFMGNWLGNHVAARGIPTILGV
ncbi:hypothetical protein SO694_0005108 [Aureococcus anophagefferens]|uniref:Uncharacterized protein n=1 Tax=Aureococcus anophagefferens TaxID=44056 RepID=A0ABR1FY15_AURAN